MWFSFGNTYLGSFLGIKNETGLTIYGWTINIILLFLYVVFSIITGLIPKRNEMLAHANDKTLESYKDTLAVNDKLIEITTELCDRKLAKISEKASQAGIKGIKAFCPIDHLNEISYNIRNCVSYITGIPHKKMTVSMLYKLKENEKWQWVNQSDLASSARFNADALVDNLNSTFNFVLNGETFVVFNDKLKASDQHHYVLDDNDNSHKKIGSIACQKIFIPIENDCIIVLLSISTYGYRFVEIDFDDESYEEATERFTENLRDKILSQFTKRISLELLTLYLQKYKSDNNPTS